MTSKSVSLSVRVSSEDAEFIANLKPPEAVTPSDKVRWLIKKARLESKTDSHDYEELIEHYQDVLKPLQKKIRLYEKEKQTNSDFVRNFIDWLSEMISFTESHLGEKQADWDGKAFEAEAARRIFHLFDQIMRLGVTAKAPCFDEGLIRKAMLPILDLAKLMMSDGE